MSKSLCDLIAERSNEKRPREVSYFPDILTGKLTHLASLQGEILTLVLSNPEKMYALSREFEELGEAEKRKIEESLSVYFPQLKRITKEGKSKTQWMEEVRKANEDKRKIEEEFSPEMRDARYNVTIHYLEILKEYLTSENYSRD